MNKIQTEFPQSEMYTTPLTPTLSPHSHSSPHVYSTWHSRVMKNVTFCAVIASFKYELIFEKEFIILQKNL